MELLEEASAKLNHSLVHRLVTTYTGSSTGLFDSLNLVCFPGDISFRGAGIYGLLRSAYLYCLLFEVRQMARWCLILC